MLRPAFPIAAFAMLLAAAPAAGEERCTLCSTSGSAGEASEPVSIEIYSGLTFSRLALTGGGDASAEIDPQTGQRSAMSGLMSLGGESVQGRGRITGTPGRAIRIDLPSRVSMTSSTGGSAELTDFVTDLPAYPILGPGGSLEFSFGGKLRIKGPVGGNLRGRIPITVDYN